MGLGGGIGFVGVGVETPMEIEDRKCTSMGVVDVSKTAGRFWWELWKLILLVSKHSMS